MEKINSIEFGIKKKSVFVTLKVKMIRKGYLVYQTNIHINIGINYIILIYI